jgi:hypothetical protein
MPEVDEKEMTWEDHLAAAIKSFRKEMKGRRMDVFPEDFRMHRRAARREMLLAWRSFIDDKIAKLDEQEKEKTAPQATRIKVE